MKMDFKTNFKILFLTILSIIISWYVAVLLHEYAHATMAWHFGYKQSPFDISYGSWYLIPVSEAVTYSKILASGHGYQEGLIGVSGITVNFLLFLVSLFLINQTYVKKNIFFLSLFFWLTDLNLIEMFSYINRTFIMGDLGEFIQGFAISPLWVFIPGSIIVCLGLYRFYTHEVIKMYALLPIKTVMMQRIFLWTTFWALPITIVYWESPMHWIIFSNSVNVISLLIVIAIIIFCDPKKEWVKNKISSAAA